MIVIHFFVVSAMIWRSQIMEIKTIHLLTFVIYIQAITIKMIPMDIEDSQEVRRAIF